MNSIKNNVYKLRVLIITSEWPNHEGDLSGLFVVNQVEKLRQQGIEVSIFNFTGHKNPWNYLRAIIKFHKFEFKKFDVIHAHHGQSGIVALTQKRVPVVVTFHGSDLQGIYNKKGKLTLLGWFLRKISFLVAQLADEVIIVSEHMSKLINRKKYHVIPIGVDSNQFFPQDQTLSRLKLGLPLEKKLILFVGNPERTEKRFWLAEESYKLICVNDHNCKLVLANGVPHRLMPLYLNSCDVLLITSLSEGSPTIVKEALSCRLPIVSVKVGDVPQQIGKIDGCVVCEDENPNTISSALIKVLKRGNRLESLVGLDRLEENTLVKNVISVYQQVVKTATLS